VLPPESLVSLLQRIRLRFPISPEAEITLEANPGTVHQEGAETLIAAGFNRFSLGVQSLDDHHLCTLGRPHTAEQAVEALRILRRAGCRDLNLDLIYGLPRPSLPQWEDSLQRALDLHPEHISAYALSLEPDTPLARSVDTGSLPAPDDDLAADMYDLTAEKLSAAGYHHYEISNFALPGHECRHNRRYWADDEYLGLGCSAHSHRRAVRWNNRPGPQVYIEWLERGRLPVARVEALGAKDRVGEMLMLGLRRAEGVTDDDVFARCGLRPGEVFAEEIEQLAQQGLLLAAEGRLQIPREKWVISNEVLSHFVA
jgi:oxygen-independent coproporphyrinogen-3 oxidase